MRQNTKKSFRINFKKTFENLKAKLDELRTVIPATEEGGKERIKEGVKQSVYCTVHEIYRLHILNAKKSSRPGSLALTTKTCSLAKVIRASERTVRRHISKLLDLGLLYAKNRLGHGIQLVLNSAIIAYDELKIVIPPTPQEQPPVMAPEAAMDDESLVALVRQKFTAPGLPSLPLT